MPLAPIDCIMRFPSEGSASRLLAQRGRLVLFGSCLELALATEEEALRLGDEEDIGGEYGESGRAEKSIPTTTVPSDTVESESVATTTTPLPRRIVSGLPLRQRSCSRSASPSRWGGSIGASVTRLQASPRYRAPVVVPVERTTAMSAVASRTFGEGGLVARSVKSSGRKVSRLPLPSLESEEERCGANAENAMSHNEDDAKHVDMPTPVADAAVSVPSGNVNKVRPGSPPRARTVARRPPRQRSHSMPASPSKHIGVVGVPRVGGQPSRSRPGDFGQQLTEVSGRSSPVGSPRNSVASRWDVLSPMPTARKVARGSTPTPLLGEQVRSRRYTGPPLHHRPFQLRRAESAPPEVFGVTSTVAAPHGFSARQWSVAVSPLRLEALRQQVHVVHREASLARLELDEDRAMCDNWAAQMEAGRLRLRELREEEAAALAAQRLRAGTGMVDAARGGGVGVAGPNSSIDAIAAASPNEALRVETEALAHEVSIAAARQLARCQSLRDLQAASQVARLKRGARTATEVRKRLGAERRECAHELDTTRDALGLLSLRACELREAVGKEATFTNVQRAGAVVPEASFMALRSELVVEEQHCRSVQLEEAGQVEAQAALRCREAEVAFHLAEAQAGIRRLGEMLRDAERRDAALRVEVMFAQDEASEHAARLCASTATHMRLEAELQQQRDATLAWQMCVNDLSNGHQDICVLEAEGPWRALASVVAKGSLGGGEHRWLDYTLTGGGTHPPPPPQRRLVSPIIPSPGPL